MFGHDFTDHMLVAEWDAAHGWSAPVIKPYGNLSLAPSSVVFHYGIELFEGMKAYRNKENIHRLFRPDMNMDRMNRSASRLALPNFNGDELLKCVKELVSVDKEWIPNEKGYSLYIRPTMISTQESLGVGISNRAMLFVICSPVGPYYKHGFNPVKLLADPQYVRAWPGGTGDTKIGGNYAPTIMPQLASQRAGANQVLWLFGDDHSVTEVGTMNLFIVMDNKESGKRELVTPPLDGTILPGITRDSIIKLAEKEGVLSVSERKITMSEIVEGLEQGNVVEVFGAGTACIVSPVEEISYLGKSYKVPLALGKAGEYATHFNDTILGIQYGDIPSDWSVELKDHVPTSDRTITSAAA